MIAIYLESSYDLVVSCIEWKGFFPKIIFEFMEEFIFSMPIPMLWDRSSHKKIDNVREPCLPYLKCEDAISDPPPSFRCPSYLLSPSQTPEEAAPIVSVVVLPLSWKISTSMPHDRCR